ncbi:MAG: helix-turn-helix domain-containing protein [Acidobacteriota bacterium]
MYRAFKYKLKPTTQQIIKFEQIFKLCRELYPRCKSKSRFNSFAYSPGRYKIVAVVWVVSIWAIFASNVFAGDHQLWGNLPAGSYQVGFRSICKLDYTRTYHTTFADKSSYGEDKTARPILINIWYPTNDRVSDKAMRHREYLDLPTSEPQLDKFSTALSKYNREVICQEVIGKPLAELTTLEAQLLDQFLDTPTTCQRNATPAPGKFPLVIYHSGYGSSFEDNAVLCEFLASHGYVVVGSAFQDPTGASFNVDGKMASVRDMEFLIAYAQQLSNVDWRHVGVVGHSGGAHAVLRLRAQENSVIDAVVSLDTTQDYYSLADPRWSRLITTVTEGRHQFTGPLLVVAKPHAFFPMFDTLDRSRRYYLTLRDLEHNEFISQGCIRQNLRVQLLTQARVQAGTDKPGEEEAKELVRLRTIRRSYESLNQYVLWFLNAYLKEDQSSRNRLVDPHLKVKLGGSEPHMEYVPEGTTNPPAYRSEETELPLPRQLRPYLQEHGIEKTVVLLKRVYKKDSTHSVLHPVFLFALVYQLLDQGKNRDAAALAAFARELHPDFNDLFVINGETFARVGKLDYAIKCLQMALVLEPGNQEVARKLQEVEKLRAK